MNAWLAGEDPLPEDLTAWWSSYRGHGRGEPTREAFAEPFVGDWHRARLVTLGLNPGPPDLKFQGSRGIFSRDIRKIRSYSEWAKTDPYGSKKWEEVKGRNVYRAARLRFARTWLDDAGAEPSALMMVELYPWHSDRVTGAITPPPDVLETYIWQPLAELRVDAVFAFGAPWRRACKQLGLEPIERWGKGGKDFGSPVPSRAFETFHTPSGQRIVVSWQQGYAGPPNADDILRMRAALQG